ncbi:uncharacterized protein sfi1 isoform 1-T1 [Syngnathus typhle]
MEQYRLPKRKLHSVTFSIDTKVSPIPNSYIPKRTDYSWDKCGRTDELRIRNLARKFLKTWRQNTFGRILPHKAKCHYDSVLLGKTFEAWKEEWWTFGRGWSLSVRAKCHYRYYLLYMTFRRWQTFMSLQVDKKDKIQKAQAFVDRRRMRQMWDKWKFYCQTHQQKIKALQLAQEQHRRTSLQSAWHLWQARFRQQQNIPPMEDQDSMQGAIEKESKASLHFSNRVKKKSFLEWQSYVSCSERKKSLKADAQRFARLHLMKMSWRVWRSEWHRKQRKEEHLEASGQLACRASRRRALLHWRTYVTRHRQKANRGQIASQHYHRHLQCVVLQGLSQNVSQNKAKQLIKNTAVQHHHQTVIKKHWRLWKDRLEEAEDKSLQALIDMADTNYRMYLMSHSFDHWRRKLVQQSRMQELEWRADVWFAERWLAHYFGSWCEYALLRSVKNDKQHKADVHNKQRLCTWVLCTWRARTEQHKDEMLMLRLAILHEEQSCVQRAWARWKERTEQQKKGEDKQKEQTSEDCELPPTLLAQREDTSAGLQARLKMSDLTERALWHWALTLQAKVLFGWRLWVREQRRKKAEAVETKCAMSDTHQNKTSYNRAQSSLNQAELLHREQIDTEKARKHYDSKLLTKVLRAWKKHQHTRLKYKVMKQQGILLRKLKMYETYFVLWRRKFEFKVKLSEQTEQALWHWALTLQAKMFHAWRLWVQTQRKKKTEVAQVDDDESTSAAVTYIDDIRSLTETEMQRDEEPQSLHLQRVVKCCAMKWKQRALFVSFKKPVTFHYPDSKLDCPSDSRENDVDDSELIRPLVRRQPRRCEELFAPSSNVASLSSSRPSGYVCHVSYQKPPASILDTSETPCELLLPPAAFMNTENKLLFVSKMRQANILSPTAVASLENISPTSSDIQSGEPCGDSANDPTSTLMRELMSIQQDMRSFQQDRKQLRLWQKVKDVLQSWLQSSGKDEEIEKMAVCQQVKELEERIEKLSCELGTRRLTMRFHAERLQHLQAVLDCSGFASLYRQIQM